VDAILGLLGAVLPAVSFEGLSVGQWLTIASAVYSATPEIKAAITALHPALAAVAADLDAGKSPDEAAAAAQQRAATDPFNPAVPR
jgi:hypothetical protein